MLGDFGEVYVLDWGIAKVVGTPDTIRGNQMRISVEGAPTAEGAILGTPGYMAPEQLSGYPLDARAEVYALGAILFELLTHEPLHARETVDSIKQSTLDGVDARVTTRAPLKAIPPELDAICVQATAVEPKGRYFSVRELSDAIELFLDGDRDLELRKTKAKEHAASAAVLARQAMSSPDESHEARRSALQEAGRALAFDPTHVRARDTLLRLLTTPPAEMPADAVAEQRLAHAELERLGGRLGAVAYLAWLGSIPLLLWLGVRDWIGFSLFAAAQVFAAAACLWRARVKAPGGAPFVVVRVAIALATASMATFFGPLIVVPTVATAATVSILLHPSKKLRGLILACGCLTVATPLLLQWLGVIHASYTFDAGAIVMRPWALELSGPMTLLTILIMDVGTMVMVAVLAIQTRDTLTEAERRLAMHAWNLRQLVPEATD
jgi:hypothetical protein